MQAVSEGVRQEIQPSSPSTKIQEQEDERKLEMVAIVIRIIAERGILPWSVATPYCYGMWTRQEGKRMVPTF